MNQLQLLDLTGNRISELEANALNGLISLDTLYLKRNKLVKIDFDLLNRLKCLKWLHLSENKINEKNKKSFIEFLEKNDRAINVCFEASCVFSRDRDAHSPHSLN